MRITVPDSFRKEAMEACSVETIQSTLGLSEVTLTVAWPRRITDNIPVTLEIFNIPDGVNRSPLMKNARSLFAPIAAEAQVDLQVFAV